MAKRFRVSKTLKGELILSCVSYTLKAGQVIEIQDEQMFAPDIQVAINKNIILPEKSKPKTVTPEKPSQEEIVDVKSKKSRLSDLAIETNMHAYDLEKKELMDNVNSQKVTFERQGIEVQEFAQVGEVNFEDEDEDEDEVEVEVVVKKPTKKATKKSRKKTAKKSRKKTAKKTVNKLKKAADELTKVESKSIKAIGRVRPEPTGDPDLLFDGGDDLSFVDEEQEQQRVKSRRKLTE